LDEGEKQEHVSSKLCPRRRGITPEWLAGGKGDREKLSAPPLEVMAQNTNNVRVKTDSERGESRGGNLYRPPPVEKRIDRYAASQRELKVLGKSREPTGKRKGQIFKKDYLRKRPARGDAGDGPCKKRGRERNVVLQGSCDEKRCNKKESKEEDTKKRLGQT